MPVWSTEQRKKTKEFNEFDESIIRHTFFRTAGSGSTHIAVVVPGLHFLGLLVNFGFQQSVASVVSLVLTVVGQ